MRRAFLPASRRAKADKNGGFPIRGSNAKPEIDGEAADADCGKGGTGETAFYHRLPCAMLRERGELQRVESGGQFRVYQQRQERMNMYFEDEFKHRISGAHVSLLS